jgi:5,10-methylenetetrahydrofolate reductase
MSFREALETGKFVVTAEVGPGKGTDVEHLLKDAQIIKDRVDAINVTDLQSSVMRLTWTSILSFKSPAETVIGLPYNPIF